MSILRGMAAPRSQRPKCNPGAVTFKPLGPDFSPGLALKLLFEPFESGPRSATMHTSPISQLVWVVCTTPNTRLSSLPSPSRTLSLHPRLPFRTINLHGKRRPWPAVNLLHRLTSCDLQVGCVCVCVRTFLKRRAASISLADTLPLHHLPAHAAEALPIPCRVSRCRSQGSWTSGRSSRRGFVAPPFSTSVQ
jgi:hypothetical protein